MTAGPVHVCVGFYLNGDHVVNYVADADLEEHVSFNRKCRPGRYYFVDGKYRCGGMLREPAHAEFVRKCLARLPELHVPACGHAVRPYA